MVRQGGRARSTEQKAARREQILDAAARLFGEKGLESVTVAEIAQSAGVAKGTVYLYFNTREELFLELLGTWFAEWFDEQDVAFSTAGLTPRAVAAHIADALDNRPQLLAMMPYTHAVLEQNVTYEAFSAFKLCLAERVRRTGELLERNLSGLAPGDGHALCRRSFALILGVRQLCVSLPLHEQFYKAHPDMRNLTPDFIPELRQSLEDLILGMTSHGA